MISYVAMVPKGNAERLAYVNEFIEEAKASGLVKQTIERAGRALAHPAGRLLTFPIRRIGHE